MQTHEKRSVFNLDLKMSTFGDSLISAGSSFHLFGFYFVKSPFASSSVDFLLVVVVLIEDSSHLLLITYLSF